MKKNIRATDFVYIILLIISIIFTVFLYNKYQAEAENNKKLENTLNTSTEKIKKLEKELEKYKNKTDSETGNKNSNEATKNSEPKKEISEKDSPKPIQNKRNLAYSYDVREISKLMEEGNYKGKKIAFLTFDDGPNNVITPKVLDVLKEKNVHATFFVCGKNIGENTADTLKRIYNEGHSIATHSYNHDYDILYPNRNPDANEVLNQQNKTMAEIRAILGQDFNSRVHRYPGGHMSWNDEGLKASDKVLADNNVYWIDWNTMNGDAQPASFTKPEEIPRPHSTKEVIANFEMSKSYTNNPDIAVILMHDASDKDVTLNALPELIDHIKNQGYEFGIIE